MTTCSLIIPVYNHASYLVQCIESALKQTEPFDEIIIVDDCSPETEVQRILARYASLDRVRLYTNEKNLGITATQNFAIGKCTSKYVAFLDCDDFLSQHAMEAFRAYHAIKEADYYFSNRKEVNETGELLRNIDVSHWIYQYETLTQCLLEHMVATHFKVIRKECLDRIGGFPANSDGVQDWVVAVNIINDINAVHIAEHVYSHRIHAGQTTGQDSVRYVSVVNAERERRLETLGWRSNLLREVVKEIAPYLSRVEHLPRGEFFLQDGLMIPWFPAWVSADKPATGGLLFYMPGDHYRVSQDFYLCRKIGAESIMVVDHRVPASIAVTRWSNAFIDHIVCLDSVARLAIEPWVGDKSKIIQCGTQDITHGKFVIAGGASDTETKQ